MFDLDPQRDLGTDYILIAAGVGAALVALVYLLLILTEAERSAQNAPSPIDGSNGGAEKVQPA